MTRLLLILGVLLCSMHLAEPVFAHTAEDSRIFHLTGESGGQERSDSGSAIAHGSHHHCPVAPDMRGGTADDVVAMAREPLFTQPVSRLTSRAPPPLLDPPLA